MAESILASSGIYAIRNKINGKHYVGSSANIRRRRAEHFRELRTSTHKNIRLAAAWKKYGEAAFEFIILEYSARDVLITREQYWIDALKSDGRTGYNILPCAGSRAGSMATEETKLKMSLAMVGKTHTEETKKKLSAILTGKLRTDQMRENIRASAIASAAKKTPEQRSAYAKKGLATKMAKLEAMTNEEREIAASKRRESASKSLATKKAMGYTVSQETKDKQMAARIRRVPEDRRAIWLIANATKRAKRLEKLNANG